MSAVRVVLVDDHPVVRAGLRALLAAADGIEVVGEAGSADEAVARAAAGGADVVLMDLNLGGGGDGAEATRRIRALPEPRPRVLVLTTYDSDADILRAVEAGATGYLLKDAEPEELLRALRTAASGETVLAPVVASRLVSRMRDPAPALTSREAEILRLVAEGRSNRAIARGLFVTEATVKSHLVHVFTKLGVDSRTAAVAEARRRGLLPR
ncbi:DNA-binding response regulator [Mangrovactinospora gilvigrisea]|uniref:DNA-binding response regulator n=1 Tax=Mangrovactinospora gilvigrisea TaxID=1428644 RepID=A0A1J7BB95_9ACTN|nr:response regulator transcription factor [Mangrovactinospora gilvigrisea]OIV35923.1 DNA-binding response regulator [Mangrovactinospora gilvigrisea]